MAEELSSKTRIIESAPIEDVEMNEELDSDMLSDICLNRKSGKLEKKSVLLCFMGAILFTGWAGYTLTELVIKPQDKKTKMAADILSQNLSSRPQCGMRTCDGITVEYSF